MERGGDDRVLPATHWASLVVVCILVPALVILWGLPGRTADAWAWTIEPELTPIFMGAGYGAGAYFFLRTFLSNRFHRSAAGMFGAALFAALMLVATLIHWDRFNHGDAPLVGALVFYGWVGVYILSPAVVLWLWWRNRRMDYEVWKWIDSGAVEFRIHVVSRPSRIANPVIRLGFRLFGRREQVRFAERACERMACLIAGEPEVRTAAEIPVGAR